MSSVSERDEIGRALVAPGRRKPHCPPMVVGAAGLLCAAWAATAVLTVAVLSSGRGRTWPLRMLDGMVPGPAGPHVPVPGTAVQIGLCVLLLGSVALLTYAFPELLEGHPPARVVVWIGVPVLTAEPLRRALAAWGEAGADTTVVHASIVIVATAWAGAVLLALPSAGAYLGRRSRTESP